ncbi:MAG: SET domain-containing protein [Rhodothermales bacterium]
MGAHVYVDETNVGRGVFAARHFKPGELILTFSGPRIDHTSPLHHTEHAGNLLQTGKYTYIYPDAPGLYVNHSCEPNAGIFPHRRLVALTPVEPGEEIRFDYSTTMDDGIWTLNCLCGQPTCRHVVTDFKTLDPQLQASYLMRGIVLRFIARTYRPPMMRAA